MERTAVLLRCNGRKAAPLPAIGGIVSLVIGSVPVSSSPRCSCPGRVVSLQIVGPADPVEQADFVADVQKQQNVLLVTNVDDSPLENMVWGTEFPIYGTKYKVRGAVHEFSGPGGSPTRAPAEMGRAFE